MLRLIVLAAVVRVLLLCPPCESMSMLSKRGGFKICGSMLTQSLSLLCKGKYYDPYEDSNQNDISIRDVEDQQIGGLRTHLQPYAIPPDYYNEWFLQLSSPRMNELFRRPSSHQQHYPSHRQQRGVVDECCKKSCTFRVLRSYCGTH